jgi:dipeptidyl aminopeptidase/acylaminoacyl peptidase
VKPAPALALLAILVASSAVAGPVRQRPLALEDLAGVAELSAPAASPDGRWIAYTVARSDTVANRMVSTIWLRRWDGTQAREIAPADGRSAWAPAFARDGGTIAYLSDQSTEHDTQVWAESVLGGAARPVTDLAAGVHDFFLAPDGRHLVATAEVPAPRSADEKAPIVIDRFLFKDDERGYLTHRRRHLFVVDMADRHAVQLTRGDFDADLPAWSPDGTRIAYVSKRFQNADRHTAFQIYVIDAATGESDQRVSLNGRINNDPDHGSRPAWSPDSRRIAYLQGGEERWLEYAPWELAIADVATGAVQQIGEADHNYTHPVFSTDGRSVFALVEDRRNTYLSRIALEGNRSARLTGADRFDVDLAVGPDDRIALLSSDDHHPARLSIIADHQETFLPGHNDWLGEVALAPVSDILFASTEGAMIDGFLVQPAGRRSARPFPTIVWLHGGPQYQFSHEFMFLWQFFAAQGYAVVGVNPRGSSGRGFEFSRAIWSDWGQRDVQDVLAATDHAVALGVADPARLGVGGWSYGGLLTNFTIASTRRFRAAIAGAGSGNALGMYGTDEYAAWLEYELGTPWENLEAYLRVSFPFLHNDRIVTPTLFLCGEVDFNVPCIGSEQMYQALRSRGIPTRLVIYPGTHHEPETPAFARDRIVRYLDWYDRHLKSGTSTTPIAIGGDQK